MIINAVALLVFLCGYTESVVLKCSPINVSCPGNKWNCRCQAFGSLTWHIYHSDGMHSNYHTPVKDIPNFSTEQLSTYQWYHVLCELTSMTLNFIGIIATVKTVDISIVIAASVTSLVFIALLCGGILIRLLQLIRRSTGHASMERSNKYFI